MPNRRKIGANAFLRNAENAHKQRDTQRNWMTDSGSEGPGFESLRDHERSNISEDENLFSNLWRYFSFCRMAGASLQGSTKSIPTGSRKEAFIVLLRQTASNSSFLDERKVVSRTVTRRFSLREKACCYLAFLIWLDCRFYPHILT